MLNSRHHRLLASLLLAVSTLAGCKTVTTARFALPNAPVTYQLVSEMVDEETLDHRVKFRNVGREVVSFDYTLVDEPGVPHVDSQGPNSGLVENLYPGAEVQLKNPIARERDVHVALGRVTYGKQTAEQLAEKYRPDTVNPTAPAAGTALPLLEPIHAPGQ